MLQTHGELKERVLIFSPSRPLLPHTLKSAKVSRLLLAVLRHEGPVLCLTFHLNEMMMGIVEPMVFLSKATLD